MADDQDVIAGPPVAVAGSAGEPLILDVHVVSGEVPGFPEAHYLIVLITSTEEIKAYCILGQSFELTDQTRILIRRLVLTREGVLEVVHNIDMGLQRCTDDDSVDIGGTSGLRVHFPIPVSGLSLVRKFDESNFAEIYRSMPFYVERMYVVRDNVHMDFDQSALRDQFIESESEPGGNRELVTGHARN